MIAHLMRGDATLARPPRAPPHGPAKTKPWLVPCTTAAMASDTKALDGLRRPEVVMTGTPVQSLAVVDAERTTPESAPRSAGPFRVGDRIGDAYEITKVLGVGGMGVVYEARDLALCRRVAIKVPLMAIYTQALRAEAQALAAIRHPTFVTVHHVGCHDDITFMVMERLFGDTLESRLDEMRARGTHLSIVEILDLLIPITDALSAAHAAGIAQRDLKPSNVLVCGERVVIIDLGLFVPEVLVGAETAALGSAAYVAPEVLLQTVEPGNGPLIDLYALGILAFELLTNTTPFAAHSIGMMLAKHVGAPIPDVRTLRPETPRDLGALVTELLAKDPKSRPASAEAVLWQLKEIRDHGLRREKRMTVLAVDDEAHVGHALKRSLESAFPQVHVDATTDPSCAMRDSGALPDVVLVDLNMPKHNGIEICMSLLALPPGRRPVVVAMSAEADEDDIRVLRALGVQHYVPKDDAFVAHMSGVIRDLRHGFQTTSPVSSR